MSGDRGILIRISTGGHFLNSTPKGIYVEVQLLFQRC